MGDLLTVPKKKHQMHLNGNIFETKVNITLTSSNDYECH